MASNSTIIEQNYQSLITQISTVYSEGQKQVVKAINTTMLMTYWQIGQHIVEFE